MKFQCFHTYGVKQDFGRGVNVGATIAEKNFFYVGSVETKSRDAKLKI